MANYKYKFSFVMPIYNVEEYLSGAVESILSQDIGFKENCEIIFVNDGSPDNSEAICLRYKQKYPQNIKYIKQENQGASEARNNGIAQAQGKYISLIDPDDKISPNTLGEVYDFFENHYGKIDFVAVKIEFFGDKQGPHHLSYKFDEDRVVDIVKDYMDVQLSAASAFFDARIFKEKGHRFDPKVGQYSEDAKIMTEIVLDKRKYGLVTGPTYYYRKRGNDSALGSWTSSVFWHLQTPDLIYQYLFDHSKNEDGQIPRYIQYLVMYDTQKRLLQKKISALDDSQLKQYREKIVSILRQIDEDIILEQRQLKPDLKLFAIALRRGCNVNDMIRYGKDGLLYLDDKKIQNGKNTHVYIDFVEVVDGVLTIEGSHKGYRVDGFKLTFIASSEKYDADYINRPFMDRRCLGEVAFCRQAFVVRIPIKWNNINTIVPYVEISGNRHLLKRRMKFLRFTGLNHFSYHSYKATEDVLIKLHGNALSIKLSNRINHTKLESRYMLSLLKAGYINVVLMRAAYFLAKILHGSKPVWLLSDRPNTAGDNADWLFQYICSQKPKDYKVYFSLQKSHPRFRELRELGKVVDFGGFKYKVLSMIASKRISSQFDRYITNPFGEDYMYYSDLINFDSIYLEHGILASDSSIYLNRWSSNFKLVTVATQREKTAFNEPRYGYDKSVIRLTGHSRFDPLIDKSSKTIILMPTWRQSIAGKVSVEKGGTIASSRHYSSAFKTTDYFKFYNNLTNDRQILSALEKYEYKIKLYIHPSLSEQWKDFTPNKQVEIMIPPHDYVNAMCEGAMMVTDYSGVQFDFAYMNKPIIYTQFDKDILHRNHYYDKGYFSYDDDGFGRVVTNYNDSVKEIIKVIKRDCSNDPKYLRRAREFFYRQDHNNAKRVHQTLLEYDRRDDSNESR